MKKLKLWVAMLYLKYLIRQRDKNFYKFICGLDQRLQLKATHQWLLLSDKAYTFAQKHNLQKYL